MVACLKKEERRQLQLHLLKENYSAWSKVSIAVILMQVGMLATSLISRVVTPRTYYYRWLYIGLIICTVIAVTIMSSLRKDENLVDLFYEVMSMYMLIVILWSIGITSIGFGSREDLSTFAYATISVCAIIWLEPVFVFAILTFCTGFLIVLLCIRTDYSLGAGTVIQIMSIFLLALIVSFVTFNRRLTRVKLEYELEKNLSEIRELNHQLEREAKMDALTGVYNRRFLTEHINDGLLIGERSTGVMMIDLDKFKRVNDVYGHRAGDECLIALGEMIQEIVGEDEGYAVRYGGEEFLIYYRQISKQELLRRAEMLRAMVKNRRFLENGKEFGFTVSIGCAMAGIGRTYSGLIKEADCFLYHAKQGGRDQVCYAGSALIA